MFKVVFLSFFLLAAPALARENKPDPKLTPGEIATNDIALVCKQGYSASVRKTTQEMKNQVYRAYKIKNRNGLKIDHLVPLSLGGADTIKNIWPSDFKAGKYNAAAKDRLELKVREMVCRREISVTEGQKLFLTNWQAAYDLYCPKRAACPSYQDIQELELKDNFHYRPKQKTETSRKTEQKQPQNKGQ